MEAKDGCRKDQVCEPAHDVRESLENAVRNQLVDFGIDFSGSFCIGAAVSGGADSIALLTSLSRILPENITLKVITVNHNIRPREETEGDAVFVEEYCASIGVLCERIDIPRGRVEELSRELGCGVEDAARRLRYEAFADFRLRNGVDYICLAHNKNDQVETVLMRFLSGGDCQSLSGIPPKRDFYLRPLLTVPRSVIEAYLSSLGIPYRTDSTNSDIAMLRNKIRHKIIPFLDGEFPSWQESAFTLSEKMRADSSLIEKISESSLKIIDFKSDCGSCSFSAESFSVLDASLRRRIVYRAAGLSGIKSRVPYRFVESVCSVSSLTEDGWNECAAGIRAVKKNGRICFGKYAKQTTESCFFATIEEPGFYRISGWNVRVSGSSHGISLGISKDGGDESVILIGNLCFPFVFRSRQPDDEIETASKGFKSVSKILEGWKCRGSEKDDIPVIQELAGENQALVAVLGSPSGYRNWIVKL